MDRQKAKRKRQLRRRRHVRKRIVGTAERPRLTVFRSNKHIYAQLIDDLAGKTLAAVTTNSADLREAIAALEADVLVDADGPEPDRFMETDAACIRQSNTGKRAVKTLAAEDGEQRLVQRTDARPLEHAEALLLRLRAFVEDGDDVGQARAAKREAQRATKNGAADNMAPAAPATGLAQASEATKSKDESITNTEFRCCHSDRLV